MSDCILTTGDILDLARVPLDRRSAELSRAVRALVTGEAFWVAGCGDPHRYERFLHKRFPDEVEWICDFTIDGSWLARVTRSGIEADESRWLG